MPIHDHKPTFSGRAFFWGGIGFGILLILILTRHNFGWFVAPPTRAEVPASMVRQGSKIVVPEGSPLRSRLIMGTVVAERSSNQLQMPGLVEADPARTATVLPQLTGRIIDLKVRLGDRVRKGQVLALLDSADLAQAYADYDKAQDARRLAHINLGRQLEQAKIGVVSDRDLDQSKSDDVQADAELHRAAERLAVLQVPRTARGSARLLAVKAPLAGSVTTLAVTPNSTINDATQPLMTIADLSTVWVTAMVPEKDVDKIAKDQAAEVTFVSYPDNPRHGRVLFIADVIEPDSRRIKIRIPFTNSDAALKPNMFATVILSGSGALQLVVPSSALLMNNDRTSVFVATAPWTFERRSVDLQLQDGSSVAIQRGVAAGEQVVVTGGILLND